MAFLGASFSNEVDFLPNNGSGETMLSAKVVEAMDPDILGWIFEEAVTSETLQTRMFAYQGQDFLDLFPTEVQQGIVAASAAEQPWCIPPYNQPEALCTALLTNSPALYLQTSQESFTLEWCHSPDDQTVPFLFTQVFLLLLGKSNVQPYVPPLDALQPRGAHFQSHFICASALSVYLSRTDGADLLMVEGISADTCGKAEESMSPTATPDVVDSSNAVALSLVSALALVAVTVGFSSM